MAKTPHFFKIILDDAIQQGKLGIPKKFVRRFGNYLSEKAFLKVPSGAKWQVELVKSGNDIWFGNGWQHFVDYYSLSLGSFLVFGFEDFQNCIFNVVIFDKTTSEINYPFHVQEDNYEEPHLEEQVHQPINQENVDVDVLPEDKSPLPSSRPHKKRKQENNRTHSEAKRGNGNGLVKKRKKPRNAEKKVNYALIRASTSYKSDNPSFFIVMQPSYIEKRFRVTLPEGFANKYFTEQQGIITLNSVDGKTWSVGYTSYRVNQTDLTRRLTMITSGWRRFVKENNLAIGDVCVFELINHNASKFNVVIYRENHDAAKSIPSIGNSKPCLKEFTNESILQTK